MNHLPITAKHYGMNTNMVKMPVMRKTIKDMQGYLQSGSEKKDLVRFHYAHREDM